MRRCVIKWFKHDTDASIDAKLQELLLDYGATGYGLYWYCIELIAKEVTPKNITFELEHDARIIARNLNLTPQETINIMKRMVELGLFDFSNNEKLRCVKIAYRLDDTLRKSLNTELIIKNFRSNSDKLRQTPTNSGATRTYPEKVHSEEEEDKEEKKKRREVDKEEKRIYSQADYKEIISHLNEITNSNFKTSSQKTKDLITARMNEGFTVDDFKQVHIIKFAEWTGTEFEKFLRPQTLYSNKFESYLNQKISDYEKMKAVSQHTGLSPLEMLKQQGYAS